MIQLPLVVELTIDESQQVYELSVEDNNQPLNMDVLTQVVTSTVEDYTGSYNVTATTRGDITLQTAGKKCTENIVVNQLTTQTPAKPHITVNNNTGIVTALVAFEPGYNDNYAAMSNNYTMQTQGARTITPTTSEQTVLTKGTFITGNIKVAAVPTYDGVTEFTPTDSEQVIEIKNLLALDNITINPVPAGYGKIGWDGQVLTVS